MARRNTRVGPPEAAMRSSATRSAQVGRNTAGVAGTEDRRSGSSDKGRRTSRAGTRRAVVFAVRPGESLPRGLPYIDGTDRLTMEDTEEMNSLPERVMDYRESTPIRTDAECDQVFVALGVAMTGAGNPEPGR